MPKHTWTLTDVDEDVYLDRLALGPADVPGTPPGWGISKRTLRGGLRDGVDLIEMDNGVLRAAVIPTRGMGIWRIMAGEVFLGWRSPVRGPVHPAFVHLWEPSGIGWLDGFDELLVRCGLESNGAPEFDAQGRLRYPLHGKIANQPARKVEVHIDSDSGTLSVCGVVEEARLFGNKLRMVSTISARVGQPVLTVTDAITNPSAEPADLELLYHINFGVPLVQPGARVVLPVARMAPRDAVAVTNVSEWDIYGPESPGTPEAVFFFDLAADAAGKTQVLLYNAAGQQGVSLRFSKTQLPYFTLWKNRQAAADGYVTGLEPGINFPNRKSFEKEKGRVAQLAPGETRTFELAIEVHPTAESVAAAQQAIAALQQRVVPQILRHPDGEWSG